MPVDYKLQQTLKSFKLGEVTQTAPLQFSSKTPFLQYSLFLTGDVVSFGVVRYHQT